MRGARLAGAGDHHRAYVEVPGGQLHYRRRGGRGGTPLVLLHQTASSSLGYAGLMRELDDDLEVIAPDTPGFGASDPLAGPVTVAGLAGVLADGLRALGVDRCWLYGHHTGAALAAQIAASAPELVRRLVLSGPPFLDDADRRRLRGAVEPLDIRGDGQHLLDAWRRHRRLAGTAGLRVAHRELVLSLVARHPEATYAAVLDWDGPAALRAITCPTYVMVGDRDPIRSGARPTHAALADSELEVIPEAGIYLADEATELVADRLRQWFRETA